MSDSAGAYHWRALPRGSRHRCEARAERAADVVVRRVLHGHAQSESSGQGAWHPSALVAIELTGERDVGDLREGRFVQAVSGTRVRFNVSPDMQISSYWQCDTQSRSIGTNSKLRWTFRAG